MGWFLQTPDAGSPKLLAAILEQWPDAKRAAGAFAFASAQGIKMLAADPAFAKFLLAGEFAMVVGLDAITDTKAVDELRKLAKTHANFKPKLFLHATAGSIFHPKTLWLRTVKGGVVITGSGNITTGGLKSNWEAMAVETLSSAEIAAIEKAWDAWVDAHKGKLRDVDDPEVAERAESNKIVRAKVKKALKKAADGKELSEEEADAFEELVEEVEQELSLSPVLIAEVPRSGDRWNQVNFDLKSYQEFFGVTLGATKHIRLYQVNDDGSLAAPEDRQAVAVKSQNFRFEIGAAHALEYPKAGHPILIFLKTADDTFSYLLLMPSNPVHAEIQKYLDDNYVRSGNKKLRVQMTAAELKKAWSDAPFFV